MISTNSTKEAIKQWLNVSASPETRDRIWREVLFVQEQSGKTNSALIQPNIWRTIMKSPITKLASAAVIIITVVFLITFFDKAAAPAYALEQTIEANHTIKTIQLRMFEKGQSIENNEFSDYWLKYDNAGKLSNLRWNSYDDDGDTFSVWNDGVLKTWMPENNVVFIIRLNNMDKKWEDFAKEFEPKFRLQWLYDMSEEKEAIEVKIDEPAEDSNSIYVKATHSVNKVRAELVVDRKTKLIKKFSIYRLREQEYELDMRIEFFAYNQPIDPSMFELSGIPDNAKVYDQVNRLVGLEKGDLTNKEIAAKVVREGLEATIAKDYDEVSRLMEGDPGDTIEEFIEGEFEAGLVRIVSIGQPETHEKNEFFVYVPCEIEVENEERGRWIVNIIATSKAIEYQDDRWIMHMDLRVSGPYILSTSTLNEQDRIEGNIIVPGLRVGDYTFGMSKDEVLRKLGEPKSIHYEGEWYTLNNLPRRYYMVFDDISFDIDNDSVKGIGVHSPLYKFTNGLGVGDSEQKIKQAFGDDFHLEEDQVKDFLIYEDKGLQFEIYTMNRMVIEIGIYQPTVDHIDSDAPNSGREIMLSEQSSGPITFPKIDRKPKPEMDEPREMNTLPKYDPDSTNPFQMDLRCRDLSKLDLSNSIDDLLYATFDDRTVWPASDKMPHDFTWQKFTELGKNPGLGIRSLHKKGITGHGVSIAILDQPLLVDHQEYAERLRLYEEIHIQSGTEPQMHGPAVASIAVGKTVGVAPEAELYYIAQWNFDWEKEHTPTLRYLAQGIHRILEVNEQLPKDKKIRVISISKGWTRSHKEYRLITEAAQKARAAGMLVVCTSIELVHDGFDFGGLGRSPLADPDVFESYNAGLFMDRAFRGNVFSFPEGNIWVPMDSRTTASPTGCDEYVFYRQGGFSWAVPYIAGVYALAAQVEPDITPERFWALAMKTGRTIELEHEGEKRSFGPIIDPVRLIRSIKAGELSNLIRKQSDNQRIRTRPQTNSETQTIVPGLRVGDYTLGMSKDDVLSKLGEPEKIFGGGEGYPLNNLPRRYIMSFGDVSFGIEDDTVTEITANSPLYKFTNGLGVGDSEEKIKQAFGNDFQLKEYEWKDLLTYEDEGLMFEIHKTDRTVMEINVYQAMRNQSDSLKVYRRNDLKAYGRDDLTDPKKAGPDFQVQGEYVGTIGSELPVGVQVIALGKHEFEGVFFTGGLPGAGWDEGTVFHIKGKTHDGETDFHGIHGDRLKFPHTNFRGSIRDGAFTGEAQTFRNRLEDVTFRLTKVHRSSPTSGKRPPKGAIVLFDGSSVEEWRNGRIVDDRLLDVNTRSKRDFGSVLIHLEFRCPFMPTARGMGRGNSGVYVKNEWEVQIIDSFAWHHENRKFERLSRFGRCGGIHEMVAPRINMSFPPLAWQTYDIEFTMAKFDDSGKKIVPAMMTVLHNGVVIHDKYVLPRLPPEEDEWQERSKGPIFLQGHGSPVRYRNIWVVERE